MPEHLLQEQLEQSCETMRALAGEDAPYLDEYQLSANQERECVLYFQAKYRDLPKDPTTGGRVGVIYKNLS